MPRVAVRPDPFTMMMNPAVVLDAMQKSERLQSLQRRVCRPLDRPLIPKVKTAELAAYDADIDEDIELDDLPE